jgi:MFS family permease
MEIRLKTDVSSRMILVTTSFAAFATPFLSSAIAFSVPRIGSTFHLDFVQAALIPMILLIPLASLMIFFGRISDDVGRARIFKIGLAIFGLASIGGFFSFSYTFLIAMVFLAGIGSSILSTNSTAIVSYVYSKKNRGFALGINAMTVYLGLTFAPFLGGLLIEFAGWRSIFLFSGPIALADLAFSFVSMKGFEMRGKTEKSGVFAALLLAGAIFSMTALVALGDLYGFLIALYISPLPVIFFILFIYFGIRGSARVIPPDLFRGNRTFTASSITALLNYLSTFSIVFVFSIYLQVILGVSPFISGLLILPEPVLMVTLSPLAGSLSDRFGSRIIASLGMLIIGFSFLALYLISPLSRIDILVLLGTIGIGFGLFSAPNTNSVMSSVSRENSGIASGFLGTMRFTGQLFSIVIATAVISSYIPRSLTVGIFSGTVVTITQKYAASFTLGFHGVMLISAILSILGAITSLVKNRGE